MAELIGLVSGERLACFSESCGPLPDLGAAANAPRLGSVASGVPSGGVRSPRKVRLLRRAPRRLRPVAAGAPSSQAAPPALAPLALRHRAQPTVVCKAPRPGFVPQPVPAAPDAAAAAHHFGWCLAFVASAVSQPLLTSRSQRVRSRQGILPVKTLNSVLQNSVLQTYCCFSLTLRYS